MGNREHVTLQFNRATHFALGPSTVRTDARSILENWVATGEGSWAYEIQSELPALLVATLAIDPGSVERGMTVLKVWSEEFGVESSPVH